MLPDPSIPPRRDGSRRDRRGRGLRGPLLSQRFPAWKSPAQVFDAAVVAAMKRLEYTAPKDVRRIEVAVEDVPPSDPSPWEEQAVAMGRYFAADRASGLPPRIVIYRRPIETAIDTRAELFALVWAVVVEQVAGVTGKDVSDYDPDLI